MKVFTKGGCTPCQTLKTYLGMKNIEYEEIPYGTQAFTEMQNASGLRTVPVVEINGQYLPGANIGIVMSRLRS